MVFRFKFKVSYLVVALVLLINTTVFALSVNNHGDFVDEIWDHNGPPYWVGYTLFSKGTTKKIFYKENFLKKMVAVFMTDSGVSTIIKRGNKSVDITIGGNTTTLDFSRNIDYSSANFVGYQKTKNILVHVIANPERSPIMNLFEFSNDGILQRTYRYYCGSCGSTTYKIVAYDLHFFEESKTYMVSIGSLIFTKLIYFDQDWNEIKRFHYSKNGDDIRGRTVFNTKESLFYTFKFDYKDPNFALKRVVVLKKFDSFGNEQHPFIIDDPKIETIFSVSDESYLTLSVEYFGLARRKRHYISKGIFGNSSSQKVEGSQVLETDNGIVLSVREENSEWLLFWDRFPGVGKEVYYMLNKKTLKFTKYNT